MRLAKYTHRIIHGFQRSLAFRSEVVLWLCIEIVPIIVLMYVWRSIYAASSDSVINGFSFAQIATYYTVVMVFGGLTSAHFSQRRIDEIKNGKIDYFLIRPLSYLQEIVLGHLGGKLLYALVALPFFALAISWLNWLFPLELSALSLEVLVQLGLLLTFGFILETVLDLLLVCSGFWFEEASGLDHFKWLLFSFLSGSALPLEMMPPWLRSIASILPLKFLYAYPAGIVSGTRQLTAQDGLYMGICVILAILATRVVWHKSIMLYSSAGG